MACTHGANCRLALNGYDYGFVRFVPHGVVKQLVDGSRSTIRGYLDTSMNRFAEGPLLANFSVLMEPTWEEMTKLLGLMGFTGSGTTLEITEDPPEHNVLVDYVHKVHKFTNARIGAFEWSGQKGTSPCKLMLHFFSKGWSVSDTWSASSIKEDVPYVFNGGVTLNAQGSARAFDRFRLSVDRRMFVEHNNSVTPTDICPTQLLINIGTSVPYVADTHDLLADWLTTPAVGESMILTHSYGTRSTVWTLGHAMRIAQGVPIPGKVLIRDGLHYVCGRYVNPTTSVVTPSLVVDHSLA